MFCSHTETTNKNMRTKTLLLTAPGSITWVGTVHEGSISSAIPAGLSITGSQLPISLPLGKASDPEKNPPVQATTLRFPAGDGDIVYFFDSAVQNYKGAITYF